MLRADFDAAGDEISAASLSAEGFIHCSTRAQVLVPANERFAGQRGLVLLVIDPSAVAAEIVFEDCYETGVAFPHVYGPIPRLAVRAVLDFPPDEKGCFHLPSDLPKTL